MIFSSMAFGLLIDMIGRWCRDQVWQGVGAFFLRHQRLQRLIVVEKMPHLHKNIIYVGKSKLGGSVLSLPFHFCYSVISLQLQVGPVIIWLVVVVVACLDDKW